MSIPLSATFILDDKYSQALMKIISNTKKADEATEKTKKSITGVGDEFVKAEQKSRGPLDSMMKRLTGFVSVGYAIKKVFDTAWSGLKSSAIQNSQQNTIQGLLKDDKVGKDMYQYIADYAKGSVLGRTDLAKGFTSFNVVSRDLDDMTRLFKLTERLYAKDSTQGSEGAVFALKEAIDGDTISMRNRFGIRLSGEKLRNYFDTGDISGGLDYIDQQLAKFGATQEVVDKNMGNLNVQMGKFGSNFKDTFGEKMNSASGPVVQIFGQLQKALDAGQFQPFFDLFIQGTALVGQGFLWIAQNLIWIGPLITTLVAGLIGYKTASFSASVASGAFSLASKFAAGSLFTLNTAVLASSWWLFPLILALTAGAAAFAWFGSSANKAKSDLGGGIDPGELNKAYAMTKTIDTNIVNDSPIAVNGDVQIEEDNLKYLMDLAQRDYVANFSTATLAPQLNVSVGQVNQSTDLDAFTDQLASTLNTMVDIEAGGIY